MFLAIYFLKKNLRCLNQLLYPVLSAEGLFRQVQQPKTDILTETNIKKLRTYPINKKDNWIGTSAVPSLPNSYVGSEQVQDSPPGPSPSLATPISTIVEQNRFWSFWICFNKQGIYWIFSPSLKTLTLPAQLRPAVLQFWVLKLFLFLHLNKLHWIE